MTSWGGQTCRSCGEPIMWAVTEAGKRMPVDRDPVLGGNVRTFFSNGSLRSQSITPDETVRAYVSHFVTCNDPKKWRKR